MPRVDPAAGLAPCATCPVAAGSGSTSPAPSAPREEALRRARAVVASPAPATERGMGVAHPSAAVVYGRYSLMEQGALAARPQQEAMA